MPEAKERIESRELGIGDNYFARTKWVITGTSSEITALLYLRAVTPFYFPGTLLVRKQINVTPIGDPTDIEYWDGVIEYGTGSSEEEDDGEGSKIPPKSGQRFFSFDTGSTSQTVTQPLQREYNITPDGEDTGRFKDFGGINVTKDGTQGVNVSSAEFRFSENCYFSKDSITGDYIRALEEIAWCVNLNEFRGYAPGEVLFMGANGSRRGTNQEQDGWEITFNFAVSRNLDVGYTVPGTGLTLDGYVTTGGVIVGKAGWDYMWFTYDKDIQTIGGKPYSILKPTELYIDAVYYSADFAALGIGTDPWE